MKVVCGACQAKYQIPDERVAGRKLKIRCRKCGDAIVVRGDQLAPEAQSEEPTHVNGHHDVAVGPEWHLSIEGDQHGPYSTEQMASMLREGQVAWETFAWREGYADWKTAAESDTLVRAVAAMPAAEITAPTPEPSIAPVVDDDGPTRMVGSVPPGSLAPVARASFSQRAHRAQSAPPGEVAAVAAPIAAASPYPQREVQSNGHGYARPYVSAEQAMTGERHEDSVLFSTRNLQATVSHSQASPARNGFAGGEGSGLIDIRALAALARGGQHSAPALPMTPAVADTEPVRRDDVMALASQTGAFSNLDSLRPFETSPRQTSNAVPIAIVAGSALIAAAAVFAVYWTRDPAPAQPVAAAAIAEPAEGLGAAPAEPEAPEPDPAAAAAAEPEPEKAEAAAPEEEAAPSEKVERSEKRSRASAPSKRASRGPAKGETRAKAEAAISAERAKPEPEAKAEKETKADKEAKGDKEDGASIDDLLLADAKPAEKAEKAEKPAISVDDVIADKKPASSKSRSIDELLDTAVVEGSKKPAKAAEPSAASAALSDTPSRDQVKSAMKAITPDVKACAAGQTVESPTATASITVSGSTGKVSSVRMTGVQGAVGSCIAKVTRGASFPKFAKETFSFDYPFRLQ